MVACPICGKPVKELNINSHIDSLCEAFIDSPPQTADQQNGSSQKNTQVASFFRTPTTKKSSAPLSNSEKHTPTANVSANGEPFDPAIGSKRPFESQSLESSQIPPNGQPAVSGGSEPPTKRCKPCNTLQKAAPLAERMRPRTLDDVYGQELVGPKGVLRGLIETDRVPSMILWGGPGTGKTTIARVIAHMVGSRFVEINSTSSNVAECKKLFAEAKSEINLTGRKTIIFCDEIHRFSKTQQDVFLGPVESGLVTLIGATTENPSFKIQNALLSRCRTFTLQKLSTEHITSILQHALESETSTTTPPSPILDTELLSYLSAFADGDARTALNLLELALDLSKRPYLTKPDIKAALTRCLVYDRAGDQHYDTISAFHKSIRGSDPDAALYYLARMIQSGEDPLYIARRLIVVASEDVGLADNTMLSLATAAYTAAEKIGLPEARINLAHATVALSLSKKSTRVYRGLSNATAALDEPGVAGLPIPIHLRNAPTRLMKEMGYGMQYKYNPNYVDGRVKQEYLPQALKTRVFLEEGDLGEMVDEELELEGKGWFM
ncbi:hypothetical protein MMC20_004072 [Loxospora ochrophaea]|nr:hypothetical protein [Loxospora ochrophaea]